MNRRPRIAVTGECMVELLPVNGPEKGLYRQSFSGDTLNAAVYLSRLGGLDVSYISAVGTDPLSDAMLAFWAGENIDVSLTRRLPDAVPGLYMIQLDEHGERSFQYWRSASAARSCYSGAEADALLERLASFDVVYLSGISLAVFLEDGRERLLRRLEELAGRVRICFDANFRPRLWGSDVEEAADRAKVWYRRMLPLCSMIFLSPEEAEAFGIGSSLAPEESGTELFHAMRSDAELIMKDGAKPCLILNGHDTLRVPPRPVQKIVDTTAAGDSFAAAYVHARMRGLSPEEAAKQGHVLAAAVIGEPGAVISSNRMPAELFHA